MKISLLLCLAVSLNGCGTMSYSTAEERRTAAESLVGNWSDVSRVAAADMLARYGPPDRIESGRLTWLDKGPWKRTVVFDSKSYYDADGSYNVVQQTVAYAVPRDKRDQLHAFRPNIRVSAAGSELSCLAESESTNFLTLNIADRLIKGQIGPAEASSLYARTLELAAAGKKSSYTQGLLFSPEPLKK